MPNKKAGNADAEARKRRAERLHATIEKIKNPPKPGEKGKPPEPPAAETPHEFVERKMREDRERAARGESPAESD